MEKTFKIIDNDISDGYHTFSELYEHRCLLYLALIQNVESCNRYVVEEHYDGWDLIVWTVEAVNDSQISYHVPIKYRHLYTNVQRRHKDEYQYDGHTSDGVLETLSSYILSKI